MYKPLSAAQMYEIVSNSQKGLKVKKTLKTLIPEQSTPEKQSPDKILNIMRNTTEMERLQRRRRRIKANWLNERRVAIVTTNVPKLLHSFGHHQNQELLLSPEEALFLLETNRLELLWNGVPFSIEQAYSVLLNSDLDLLKYKTFQELSRNSYKLRTGNVKKRTSSICEDSCDVKKLKLSNDAKDSGAEAPSNWKEWKQMEEETSKRKEKEPSDSLNSSSDINYPPNYHMYNFNSKITPDTKPDYDVVISSNNKELSIRNISNPDTTVLNSIGDSGSAHFYEFHQIDFDNI